MVYRTILIFPNFENMELLSLIRSKYDPIASLIRPHITLVFPFQSALSDEMLVKLIEKQTADFSPFDAHFAGITMQKDSFGNYLFLNVNQGKETLIELHDRLYDSELQPFASTAPYIPHITLGKLNTCEALFQAYEAVKDLPLSLETKIDTLSVEKIGPKGESILILEKKLG